MKEKNVALPMVAAGLFALGIGCTPEPDPPAGDATSPASDASSGSDASSASDVPGAADASGDSDESPGTADTGGDAEQGGEPDGGTSPDGGSDDDAGSGGGTGDLEAVEEWARGAARVFQKYACEQRWECPIESTLLPGSFPSLEACKNAFPGGRARRWFQTQKVRFRRDLKDGHFDFKQEQASACLEGLRSAVESYTPDCADLGGIEIPEECNNGLLFFEPNQEDGDPCRTRFACKGGLVCDRPDDSCGGECKPEGSDMDSDTGLSEGEECSHSPYEYECAEDLSCAPVIDDVGNGVCVANGSRSEGEPCADRGYQCGDGLVCVPDPESSVGKCAAQSARTAGETCRPSDDAECAEGFVCGPEGECLEEFSRSSGEICDKMDYNECADGFSCFAEDNLGSEPGECLEDGSRGEGDSCLRDDNCATDLGCANNTCKPYKVLSEGELCENSSVQPCEPGTHCEHFGEDAECRPVRAVGESCAEEWAQCEGGSRLSTACIEDQCVALKAPGEACEANSECMSQKCGSDGTCALLGGPEACFE